LDDNPRPTKRQRYQRSDDTSDEELLSSDDEGYYILEYSLEPSGSVYHPMDTTEASTAEADTKVEDWEDLKELFGRAADQYESACARSMASFYVLLFPPRRRRERGPAAPAWCYPRMPSLSATLRRSFDTIR
jgi:hypothetical protein